jgi:hypothetical protein
LALRANGLADRYFAALSREHVAAIERVGAAEWLPLDLAVAHYRACDALGLDLETIGTMGARVADRIHGAFLGTFLRASQSFGVTPWVALKQYGRLWSRLFVGGAAGSFRLGPKEARLEIHGLPLCAIPYFRVAFRRLQLSGLTLFCSKAYIREVPESCGPLSLVHRAQWA